MSAKTSGAKIGTYQVIGTRPIRHDGVEKVTGRALYGADLQMAGLLHGRVLRSPHAHARILSIDASAALSMPGVKAVVTTADFPGSGNRVADLGEGTIKVRDLCANVLAGEKALYRGHAIAGVAATTPQVASEALKRIRVEYEVLPPVMDVLEAMKPGAPILQPDLRTEDLGEKGSTPTNVAKHLRFEKGDIAQGFREAERIFEEEFKTSMVHQGYIEPHNGTALWNPGGELTIWTSTQGAFTVRDQVATMLDVPVSRVKVVPMEIGGGFGGKIPVYLEPVAALLSRKTGRPVKLLMDRTEVFEGTGPTPGTVIRVKMGARKDGRITAAQAWLAYEAGAFAGSPVVCGMMCIFAPYDVAHQLIDGYDVLLNKPKTAPYRAPGATSAAFATETGEWREAAENLGASAWQYWWHIGFPILLPSILGATLLLFGSAFGAYATAQALTGGSILLVTIVIGQQIRGDVLGDTNLGYALALGMVVVMAVCIALYTLLDRRTSRWLRR